MQIDSEQIETVQVRVHPFGLVWQMKAWQTSQKMSDMCSKETWKLLFLTQETGELISSDTAAYLLQKTTPPQDTNQDQQQRCKTQTLLDVISARWWYYATYNQHVASKV